MGKTKVFIIGSLPSVRLCFTEHPMYQLATVPEHADVIVFGGFGQIDPHLYGEARVTSYCPSPQVTTRDNMYWELSANKIKVGFGSGAIFLNIKNGGKAWQSVSNHYRAHDAIDFLISKEKILFESTHSQMMRLGEGAQLWAAAKGVGGNFTNQDHPKGDGVGEEYEPEVVWYPKTSSLCFQPNIDTQVNPLTKKYFFDIMDHIL